MSNTPVGGQQAPMIGLDTRGFAQLKKASKADVNSPEFKDATKQAAKQFEAVFLDMVMKSMRQTVTESGLFDSQATKSFQGMQDQTMVQGLSAKGVGLAAVIEKQLLRASNPAMPPTPGKLDLK